MYRRCSEWNLEVKKTINKIFGKELAKRVKYLKYTAEKEAMMKYICKSDIIIESFILNDEKLSLYSLVNNV